VGQLSLELRPALRDTAAICNLMNRLIDQPDVIRSIGMRKWAHKGQT